MVQVQESRSTEFGLVMPVLMPFEDMYLCFDRPTVSPSEKTYAGNIYFKIGAYKFIHHAP